MLKVGIGVVLLLVWLARGGTSSKKGGKLSGGKSFPVPGRPSGMPPGGCSDYDRFFFPDRETILQTFFALGYATPDDRMTMNDPGPDGSLGGGDDLPSPQVLFFQADYNAASASGILGPGAGGLDEDGFVGPCTLNALKHVMITVGPDDWRGPGVTVGGMTG